MKNQLFYEGQLVIYAPKGSNTCQIGRIKALAEDDDGAFVCYHSGETAARTRYEDMLPITNDRFIVGVTLGGD